MYRDNTGLILDCFTADISGTYAKEYFDIRKVYENKIKKLFYKKLEKTKEK